MSNGRLHSSANVVGKFNLGNKLLAKVCDVLVDPTSSKYTQNLHEES